MRSASKIGTISFFLPAFPNDANDDQMFAESTSRTKIFPVCPLSMRASASYAGPVSR